MLGPESHPLKGTREDRPMVFYSPSLNTCVFVHSVGFEGRMVVPPYSAYNKKSIDLEDLLTGQTIESHEYDLDIPAQQSAANGFEQDALSRYGPKISTGR